MKHNFRVLELLYFENNILPEFKEHTAECNRCLDVDKGDAILVRD